MANSDTIKRLQADGIDIIGSTPEQAAATLEADLKKYATLIRERGMKAD
jgi:tripartite-type tricarboxylate transporter receptor subunit TctC